MRQTKRECWPKLIAGSMLLLLLLPISVYSAVNAMDKSVTQIFAGLVDQKNRWIVLPEYKQIGKLSEGLAVFEKNKFTGYIDDKGREVIQTCHNFVGSFSDGLALCVDEGHYGYIDLHGNMTIGQQYERAKEFSEGLAAVQDPTNHLWGYVDRSGKWVIKPSFGLAGNFSEGLAAVKKAGWGRESTGTEDGARGEMVERQIREYQDSHGWVFVDRRGKIVLDVSEKIGGFTSGFKNGVALFEFVQTETPSNDSAEGFILIDKKGKVLNERHYSPIKGSPWFECGRLGLNNDSSVSMHLVTATAEYDDGSVEEQFGYADANGVTVVLPQYDCACGFTDGLCWVFLDGKWGCINEIGERVIPIEYDAPGKFENGWVPLRGEQGFTYYDKHGHRVNGEWYKMAEAFEADGSGNFWAKVERGDGKKALINQNGGVVIGWYDSVDGFGNGWAIAGVERRGHTNSKDEFVFLDYEFGLKAWVNKFFNWSNSRR